MDSNMRYSSFLTVEEMADYLEIGRSLAYKLCKEEGFPKVILGRNIRIPQEGLDNWINQKLNH